ncbi:uncharacterized protein LOC111052677 [Nilaparvata lugens]|uniref:uncharacterized protein LOC111052677 n=1 Tax=Nilaparvata lugens TaxID=108931 RepID=UPI000B9838AB|nr:uncharacterized protein LOC111052677 [Nilaparvata lugens]
MSLRIVIVRTAFILLFLQQSSQGFYRRDCGYPYRYPPCYTLHYCPSYYHQVILSCPQCACSNDHYPRQESQSNIGTFSAPTEHGISMKNTVDNTKVSIIGDRNRLSMATNNMEWWE